MNAPAYIRLCPACGSENPPAAMRCTCGAMLAGVDLSLPRAAAEPAAAAPVGEASALATAQAESATLICPHEDCGAPNPPGSDICLYCSRPLAAAADAPPPASLMRLPAALARGHRILRPLPAVGAEAELLIVEPLAGGDPLVAKIYRHGIYPRREVAERLARMDAAHKVRLFDSGVSDGHAYELMEYCAAGSLRGLLASGPLPAPRLLEVLREMAAAIAAVHAVRLLHRDLKPENVLIRRAQPLDLVLTDFGIASLQDATLRFTGVARTLAYGAPESIAGVLDEKADYWSLGIILLEALQGRHPFADLSEAVILHRLATRGMEVAGVGDAGWRKLLRGLLLRDPKARWGAAEIQRWLAGDLTLAEAADAADAPACKPYQIGHDSCITLEQLAVALARNWSLAKSDLANGLLMNWFRAELKDQNCVRFLIDLNFERDAPPDQRLLRLLLFLAPGLPPVWRGESVDGAGILARAAQAQKGDETACAWLAEIYDARVLAIYGAAGNAEAADMDARWRAAHDAFLADWADAEKRVAGMARASGVANFDDLMYGGGAGLKLPPPGLVHARVLALVFDAKWRARLGMLLQREVARLLADIPWLAESGAPETMPGARQLVIFTLLPELRKRAEQAGARLAAEREQQAAQMRELCGAAEIALETLALRGSVRLFTRDACAQLQHALQDFFDALAALRSVGVAEANGLGMRTRLIRAEPYARRMEQHLDELSVRRLQNAGWFNRHTAGALVLMLFITAMFGGRFAGPLLLAAAGTATWRILPNHLHAREIRRLTRQIVGQRAE
ncbi:MAG: protein kinase [Rhodocyclaceae bacterium]|nr:protein kinase [Rhodocyclaceae bacterium]